MYNDSKLTYIVVASLVVVLAITAYLLQGNSSRNNNEVKEDQKSQTENATTSQTTQNKTPAKTVLKNTQIIATTTVMNIPQNLTGAIIKTNMGEIEIDFASTSPNTVANFVSLSATKFYDGVRFHRVIKDFMIQTGDPLSKDLMKKDYWGTGGPGYKFKDELSGQEKYTQGTVAMANSGPNTNGSQFFIVTASPSVALPPSYTVFGHVIKGMDVAMKIQEVPTNPNDRPLSDVIIESVTLK